jgi:hypothetical protein
MTLKDRLDFVSCYLPILKDAFWENPFIAVWLFCVISWIAFTDACPPGAE